MKKFICGALLLSLATVVSCKKFIDIEPASNIDASAFYKSAADMEFAVNSAYASLQNPGLYGNACWQVGEVRSDNTRNWEGGGNFPDAEIDQFKESSSNNIINIMWLDGYHGIFLCNIVLDKIGNIDMTPELKKQFTGEMLFIRALIYFNLVRTFGDVPLVLKETSLQESYMQGRVKADSVYDQIVLDLTNAGLNLPSFYSSASIGRVTKEAAKSLLGKVLLTRGDYLPAALVLKEVIESGGYHLLGNYADLWVPSNANNAESIFEVQYKKGGTGTGSPYVNFFAPRNSGLAVSRTGFAYGRNLPTPDMVSAYEQGDLRKDMSLSETYVKDGTIVYDPYTIKYRDVPSAEGDADNNWVVLRYADVMLMYAEALNEVNSGPDAEAYQMIDSVRHRAGLGSLDAGLNKAEFAEAIAQERRVELAFEGHRWFDLVRTGRAVEIMNAHFNGSRTIQQHQLLFPVPLSQINVSPTVIKQNPGY